LVHLAAMVTSRFLDLQHKNRIQLGACILGPSWLDGAGCLAGTLLISAKRCAPVT
jgi:hypothetical protein